MKRVVLVLALACLVLAPLSTAAAAATPASTPATADALSDPVAASLGAPNNTTTTTAPATTSTPDENDTGGAGGPPDTASTVRILPVQLDTDVSDIQVAEQGATYNTSGPFALFSVSERVEKAAIQQPGAKATVLEGGNVVRVQYADDAAPVGKQSLYRLQLWFDDGSSRELELYASDTSISVGAASMRKYRPVIQEMLTDAEQAGYERSPDGLQSHYDDVQETAQLLDSLLTEQAKRLFAGVVGILANPLGIALTLISVALIAFWQLKRHGQSLKILTNDSGKAARLRERLWIEYENQQQTAADEYLREVDGIDEMGEIYWSDAYGVSTTAYLAELFHQGVPVKRDGETVLVGGVDDLDADAIESSWLEAVTRPERLPAPEIALTHGKKALHRMISKYGMGHRYQESYETVRELIDELDDTRDVSRYAGRAGSTSSDTGAVAGGDD